MRRASVRPTVSSSVSCVATPRPIESITWSDVAAAQSGCR